MTDKELKRLCQGAPEHCSNCERIIECDIFNTHIKTGKLKTSISVIVIAILLLPLVFICLLFWTIKDSIIYSIYVTSDVLKKFFNFYIRG